MYSPGVSGAQIDPYHRSHVLLRGVGHAGPEGQEKREPVQHHADLNESAIHKSIVTLPSPLLFLSPSLFDQNCTRGGLLGQL